MRHRLLAIDVLSGLHRINGNFSVPMVGRCNQNGVNVFSLEQLAVVQMAISLANVFGAGDPPLIDIGHSHHTDVVFGRTLDKAADMARSLAAAADHSDTDSVIGAEGC